MACTTFMSYNTTGLDSVKVRFSLDICEAFNVDFLAFQEHFKFVNADYYLESTLLRRCVALIRSGGTIGCGQTEKFIFIFLTFVTDY